MSGTSCTPVPSGDSLHRIAPICRPTKLRRRLGEGRTRVRPHYCGSRLKKLEALTTRAGRSLFFFHKNNTRKSRCRASHALASSASPSATSPQISRAGDTHRVRWGWLKVYNQKGTVLFTLQGRSVSPYIKVFLRAGRRYHLGRVNNPEVSGGFESIGENVPAYSGAQWFLLILAHSKKINTGRQSDGVGLPGGRSTFFNLTNLFNWNMLGLTVLFRDTQKRGSPGSGRSVASRREKSKLSRVSVALHTLNECPISLRC